MQAEFEQASFGLKPGEVSPVIETQSGLHIIERYVIQTSASPVFTWHTAARFDILLFLGAALQWHACGAAFRDLIVSNILCAGWSRLRYVDTRHESELHRSPSAMHVYQMGVHEQS